MSIEARRPNVSKFLDQFTDAFGIHVAPAALLGRRHVSKYKIEALAAFRDLTALSVIPLDRSIRVSNPSRFSSAYSDSFSFYPWSLGRDDQYVILDTLAMRALHLVDELQGQTIPELPRFNVAPRNIDRLLLAKLAERWSEWSNQKEPPWHLSALFRSLNMAFQAARMPAGADVTIFDVGRSLALWVSAFEILAHPGKGISESARVYDLFDRCQWLSPDRGKAIYKLDRRGRRGSVAHDIYRYLYSIRNDFLHGNPIKLGNLATGPYGLNYLEYAAPLYRFALAGFLNLEIVNSIRGFQETRSTDFRIPERSEFNFKQHMLEAALAGARASSPQPVPDLLG